MSHTMSQSCFLVFSVAVVVIALNGVLVVGDTLANCSYPEIQGDWTFTLGDGGNDNTLKCAQGFKEVGQYNVSLKFPNFAIDKDGNVGTWTLIYNQGFEVVIAGRKFFAFSYFTQDGKTVTSFCDTTFPGWAHNVDETNWRCFHGNRSPGNKATAPKRHRLSSPVEYNAPYIQSVKTIKEINGLQTSWKAAVYTEYESYTVLDMMRRAGGRRSAKSFPQPAPVTPDVEKVARLLPDEFDWRNTNGQNFVSPIRNQGKCGSCYAFGSMAMLEARMRIYTNNTVQKVFSTQDIVSCSEYSQGCEGGFPYLTAGKYGEDFGVIDEKCFEYIGKDAPCQKTTCARYKTRDYYYVGGFYGACNEPLMRLELVQNGPIAVSFEVYPDFEQYKGGIYHHTGVGDKFNPWEITNHVVLVVGYGQENGQNYWTVKNSWGPQWGEDGFFRIRRGNDECSIESMAVGTLPVL